MRISDWSSDVCSSDLVFPGASLVKAREQWNAMLKGQIDITSFPLDYASGQHPEFGATLMPGLVKNHEHAKRINASTFMGDMKRSAERRVGVECVRKVRYRVMQVAYKKKKNHNIHTNNIQ